MAKVAINGLGRIGRAALKIIMENPDLELVAVNDLIPAENLAYLLEYDSVYGRYGEVKPGDGSLTVKGKKIPLLSEKDPASLPWKDMNVDVVFECTGIFTKKDALKKHLDAGAKKVILSAPGDIDTIVYGTNHKGSENMDMLSCASCTTNCITPVMEIMRRRIGIKKALMTTIHAYTSTQNIVDGPSKKMRRGRAGAVNLVPTSTGAAVATTKAIPELKGRFDGVAVRSPVPVGSISDITIVTEKETSAEEINSIFKEEAESEQYKNVLAVSEDPIVSSDIIQNPHASIVDLGMTQVVDGDLVKIMAWYDNEWGYANQMIREAVYLT
ncbi:MAG: type I glyceraldehyde-3-phosphate dehydrogenase [Spirochaetia bacterium]